MGLIQNLLKGIGGDKKEMKARFKQVQEDDRIMEMVEERKKSSNQRDLERYMKEDHEARIKVRLQKIQKKKNSESWKSPNMVLQQKSTLLDEGRPILKEKNIFVDNKSKNPLSQKGMFFK